MLNGRWPHGLSTWNWVCDAIIIRRYSISNPRCCTCVQQLVLFILYHSLLEYIRLPLYLTPSTYLRIVVPVPGQVQTWCYCIQQCRCPNPLSYHSEEIIATTSSQSSYSSVQNRNVEKKPNQSCQSVIPFVMGDVSREDSTSLWWHRGWSLQLCSS